MGSTTSSTSAAITAPPTSIEPPEPKPSRPGPRSPAWPLGHKPSWDRPSCALSRPEPIKLTVPLQHRRQRPHEGEPESGLLCRARSSQVGFLRHDPRQVGSSARRSHRERVNLISSVVDAPSVPPSCRLKY